MHRNALRLPWRGPLARAVDAWCNSTGWARARRAVASRLPFVVLRSDVVDVVYASWLVPLPAVLPLVPPGVRLFEANGQTVVTVLTYRHGHFGPAWLGPLRRLLPSPLQSNWRLYVDRLPDGSAAQRVVLFVRNIFSSAAHAVAARLFSDALPSHVAPVFTHQANGAGYRTRIEGGAGSAPAFSLDVSLSADRHLPPAWLTAFADWTSAVQYLCLQDAALTAVPGLTALAQAGIDLPIDVQAVRPAEATACDPGALLQAHGVAGTPFCFVVPQVPFRVLWERCR